MKHTFEFAMKKAMKDKERLETIKSKKSASTMDTSRDVDSYQKKSNMMNSILQLNSTVDNHLHSINEEPEIGGALLTQTTAKSEDSMHKSFFNALRNQNTNKMTQEEEPEFTDVEILDDGFRGKTKTSFFNLFKN